MKQVLTGAQMKECDRKTIEEFGIPSPVLMERAALACVEELLKLLPEGRTPRILTVCGKGNNGGDGVAIARILKERGLDPVLWMPWDWETEPEEFYRKLSLDCGAQLRAADAYGVKRISLEQALKAIRENEYDVIVDAMFGVGLSRELKEPYVSLIREINRCDSRVLAVDMPTGIHTDTGQCMGMALKADVTVTFGFYKRGQILYPGRSYCGSCVLKDIGITALALPPDGNGCFVFEPEDLQRLPARRADSNKGTYGKVLLAAGSRDICGAAYLSGMAVFRTGAGLLQIVTEETNRKALTELIPEALFAFYRQDSLTESWIREKISWATAAAVGPGLGTGDPGLTLLKELLRSTLPLVIDADGLNLLAAHKMLEKERLFQRGWDTKEVSVIITPHMAEMSRLTGVPVEELKKDPAGYGKAFAARYGCVCVLKDACTAVCDPEGRCFLNTTGNSGMAKGGSGDVLTGVICGLLAQKLPLFESAVLGVYLHGLAGDRALDKKGPYSFLARDLIREIGELINEQ